jgi:hypothetical protein
MTFTLKLRGEGAHRLENAHHLLNMMRGVAAFASAFNESIYNVWVDLGKPRMTGVELIS